MAVVDVEISCRTVGDFQQRAVSPFQRRTVCDRDIGPLGVGLGLAVDNNGRATQALDMGLVKNQGVVRWQVARGEQADTIAPADDRAVSRLYVAAEALNTNALSVAGGDCGAGLQRQLRLRTEACTKLAAGDLASADPCSGATVDSGDQTQSSAITDDPTIGNGRLTGGQLNAVPCTQGRRRHAVE
ncbi:hypothetical protein D3C71_1276110 [compost metagenome]